MAIPLAHSSSVSTSTPPMTPLSIQYDKENSELIINGVSYEILRIEVDGKECSFQHKQEQIDAITTFATKMFQASNVSKAFKQKAFEKPELNIAGDNETGQVIEKFNKYAVTDSGSPSYKEIHELFKKAFFGQPDIQAEFMKLGEVTSPLSPNSPCLQTSYTTSTIEEEAEKYNIENIEKNSPKSPEDNYLSTSNFSPTLGGSTSQAQTLIPKPQPNEAQTLLQQNVAAAYSIAVGSSQSQLNPITTLNQVSSVESQFSILDEENTDSPEDTELSPPHSSGSNSPQSTGSATPPITPKSNSPKLPPPPPKTGLGSTPKGESGTPSITLQNNSPKLPPPPPKNRLGFNAKG